MILCLSSLFFVLGTTLGALFVSFSFVDVIKSLRLIITSDKEVSSSDFFLVSEVLKQAGKYSVAFGVLGSILGIIYVLANLGSLATLGKGLAIVLTSVFYGVGFAYLLFIPLSVRFSKCADKTPKN